VGKKLGADHFVFAELSSLRTFQRSKRKEGQFFFFSLSLIKVSTMEKIPVNVKIQKVASKGYLGW